jgi:hypothetical protein
MSLATTVAGWTKNFQKNETAKNMPIALAFKKCTWRRQNWGQNRMREKVRLFSFLLGFCTGRWRHKASKARSGG